MTASYIWCTSESNHSIALLLPVLPKAPLCGNRTADSASKACVKESMDVARQSPPDCYTLLTHNSKHAECSVALGPGPHVMGKCA